MIHIPFLYNVVRSMNQWNVEPTLHSIDKSKELINHCPSKYYLFIAVDWMNLLESWVTFEEHSAG